MFTQDGYRRRTGAAADALDSLTRPSAAQADSIAPAQGETDESVSASGFDAYLVKESFQRVMSNASLAMEYFYSHLFTVSPETRGMFPMGMSQIRDRLFAGLATLVWSLDSPEDSRAYLAQLGRDHRKYGVKDRHYHAFFTVMLATAAHFNGADWTPETEAAWQGALAYAARTMRSAAEADARNHPPWWVGEIVGHDRRGDSVAVVTIRPDRPFPYRPGQYLTLQVTRWPRIWRAYSIANAPRSSGLIDLHVRAVPGGMVSTTLVRHAALGDTVLLGPARGEMMLPGTAAPGAIRLGTGEARPGEARPGESPRGDRYGDPGRDLLCVAGGTGLAPLKAIVEEVALGRLGHGAGQPRRITLFAGARRQQDLYDLADLQRLQAACPGLQVIPVLSDEQAGRPGPARISGLLPDVVRAHGLFENSEAFICGPEAMVRQTTLLLAAHVPAEQIHHDPLPDDQARPSPAAAPPPADTLTSLSAKFARPGFPPGG
ncbi:MAG: globin domain-containing protein [Streptosporangiaceae bacterium]